MTTTNPPTTADDVGLSASEALAELRRIAEAITAQAPGDDGYCDARAELWQAQADAWRRLSFHSIGHERAKGTLSEDVLVSLLIMAHGVAQEDAEQRARMWREHSASTAVRPPGRE